MAATDRQVKLIMDEVPIRELPNELAGRALDARLTGTASL
jgi:hypothetical protein